MFKDHVSFLSHSLLCLAFELSSPVRVRPFLLSFDAFPYLFGPLDLLLCVLLFLEPFLIEGLKS